MDGRGMNRGNVVVVLVCAAVLLVAPLGAVAQLQNGDFDDSGGALGGWSTFNNVVPNVVGAEITPYSGAHVAKVFGGFNASLNHSGLQQGLPATAGQVWRARTHARHNSGDSLVGTQNRLLLQIEFFNVFGGAYGSGALLQESGLTILDANSPTDAWRGDSLQVTAPPGTVEARVALTFEQSGYAAGAALIDGVALDLLTAPWTVIWQDQFGGGAVDTTKWNIVDGHTGGNNELNYYAPDDVYVSNGNLVLRSQARSYAGYSFTSGQVNTYGRFSPVYGRIEVRAKLPWGQGFWPAHWMMAAGGGWPPEIDLMELIGSNPWCVTMSHHWGPLPPGVKPWEIGQTAGATYCGPDFTQAFHSYVVEWWPNQLFFYIDDVLRASSLRPQVPNEPMFIILNTAVGGDWPGPPDGSTPFPSYHLIDYVRVSVPSDPGEPRASVVDAVPATATTDGLIETGEYAGAVNGINHGLADRIGASSVLHLDSGADGGLHFGFDSANAWATSGPWGAVIYIDSVPGGFASTVDLTDTADLWRRLVCGKGLTGQRADLYFALGFCADYAICLAPDYAAVYALDKPVISLINGAALGAETDLLGGHDVRYRIDDGSAGGTVREVQVPQAYFGLASRGVLNGVVTMLNGDTAFRSNEFFGVAPGNAWDGVYNPGQTPVILKLGDFVRLRCAPEWGDYDADGAVSWADFTVFAGCLRGPGATPVPPAGCLGAFDSDGDVDTDLADFAVVQRATG
jgi:beta-glucanase (GH16 family)